MEIAAAGHGEDREALFAKRPHRRLADFARCAGHDGFPIDGVHVDFGLAIVGRRSIAAASVKTLL